MSVTYSNIFDDSSHEQAITAFRSLLAPEISISMSDSDLLRFLRARQGSTEKAMEMLLANDQWRHTLQPPMPPRGLTFSPNTIWAMPDHVFDHAHIDLLPVAHHGFTRDGHPIYWERTGYIQSRFSEVKANFTVEELLQYHIQIQESNEVRMAYASKKFGKLVTQSVNVIDMKHLSMWLDLQAVSYMKQMLKMDQDHYPETLHKLFIINAPRFFSAIFTIFKPFIDARTLEKFQILGGDYMSELEKVMDRSVIPVEMGGECVNVPWGGPFEPESGAGVDDVLIHFKAKYSEDRIDRLLHADEIVSLKKGLELLN